MEDYSAALTLLLSISCVHLPSADTHTLQYLYTAVTPGLTDFPEFTAVGLLDGEQFMFYSSDIRTLIIKDWIKKTNNETYWLRETQEMWGNQYTFTNTFTTIMEEFHHSDGVHTLQRMFGCECDDDVTTRGYDQYGYDGEDFMSLNLTTGTWTAVKPQAVNIKHTWESKGSNKYWKNFLEHDCIDLLKYYLSHSNHTLDRKGGGSGGAPIAIIVGVIIALLILAVVVAGVVIYKKKNSGFKPVPPKPSSEGDSSTNNKKV